MAYDLTCEKAPEVNGVLIRFLWTLEQKENLLFGITARSLASIGD
jgi:hypothetical protein